MAPVLVDFRCEGSGGDGDEVVEGESVAPGGEEDVAVEVGGM